ncbi:hypothetical protein ACOMHN_028107 [Nucella lapillus]
MSSEIQAKRQKLDQPTDGGDGSESEDVTEDELQKALEGIDSMQNELDKLNQKANQEILAVEQKYSKRRQVFFNERNAFIDKIPNFWVLSLLNHPQIAPVVNQKEKECLQYLSKVQVDVVEDIKSGYTLTFKFKTNPFFTNEVLSKEFHLDQRGQPCSKSTVIDWKDGMDFTKLPKPAPVPGKGNKRRALQQSFFPWFLDNTDPSMDELAEVIKDDLWPNPLQHYLDSSDRDLSENGYSDEDDDDDDDDDDLDESVVVVEDDDDDENEIYEVEDDDDELDTTGDVEVIEEEEAGVEELEDEDDDADNSEDKGHAAGKQKAGD